MHTRNIFYIVLLLLAGNYGTASARPTSARQFKQTYTDSVFTPDSVNGWGSYSSYLQIAGDSVVFELILYRNPNSTLDWGEPSHCGTVSSNYVPALEADLEFDDPTRKWSIVVRPDGNCYLRLISGPDPGNMPAVVAFQTKYKK